MNAKLLLGLSLLTHVPLLAAAPQPDISSSRILQHTKVLASDAFEGRAPGSAGENKTVAYLEQQFRELGLQPGNPDGTYLQQVPLIGIASRPQLSYTTAGKTTTLQPITEYVGWTTRQTPHVEATDTELVFVGYGIVAPEFGWDDYKGVDVRGKTIVMLINDPPVVDPKTGRLDHTMFDGRAMTYYGRWTYKYEIAAEKGAAGCLIVHETKPAAYPFEVVVGSRSRENFDLRSPDGNASRVALEGWLTLETARTLFAATGHDYETLKQQAATRDFKPVALGATASFTVDSTLRQVDSRNVLAKLPGADPRHANDYIVYSAHWDHLGRDRTLPGDQIFNGALDNASGVAALLELARAFAALPADQRPRRSVLFLSVTAEEQGLLGSRYYASHPLYPLEHTLVNLNIDGANPYEPTRDIEVVGFGLSSVDDVGAAVARDQHREIRPEPEPERGSYFRSDHFEFAKRGVPGYYPKFGRAFVGRPADFGDKFMAEYIARDYHKVTDEVRPDWSFAGAAQDAAFLFEVGRRIAGADDWPAWRPGSAFRARREAMLRGR